MSRGPRVDPEVKRIVARLVAEGERSPAAIYRAVARELDATYGDKWGVKRPYLPSERTIARLVRELERQLEPDDTRPWTLGEAKPEEAAVIMPVLGAVLRRRTTGRPWISAGLAKWILKVAAAAPTLPPYDQYVIAREYWAAELSAARSLTRPYLTDPHTLDAFLACRPWDSPEAAEAYERLIERGIVGQPIYIGKWWRSIGEQKGTDHGEATREP